MKFDSIINEEMSAHGKHAPVSIRSSTMITCLPQGSMLRSFLILTEPELEVPLPYEERVIKSISYSTPMWRIRSAMKTTAPESRPTHKTFLPAYSFEMRAPSSATLVWIMCGVKSTSLMLLDHAGAMLDAASTAAVRSAETTAESSTSLCAATASCSAGSLADSCAESAVREASRSASMISE